MFGRLLLGPIVTLAMLCCCEGQLLLGPMSLRPGPNAKMLIATQANFLFWSVTRANFLLSQKNFWPVWGSRGGGGGSLVGDSMGSVGPLVPSLLPPPPRHSAHEVCLSPSPSRQVPGSEGPGGRGARPPPPQHTHHNHHHHDHQAKTT